MYLTRTSFAERSYGQPCFVPRSMFVFPAAIAATIMELYVSFQVMALLIPGGVFVVISSIPPDHYRPLLEGFSQDRQVGVRRFQADSGGAWSDPQGCCRPSGLQLLGQRRQVSEGICLHTSSQKQRSNLARDLWTRKQSFGISLMLCSK